MSLDTKHFRHALFLATGAQADIAELTTLTRRLEVVEEGLAYLLLRRDGFAECHQLQTALSEAASRAPSPSTSGRQPRGTDAIAAARTAADLKTAMRAAIDQNLAGSETAAHLDDALREAAQLGPPSSFDAQFRIRRPG